MDLRNAVLAVRTTIVADHLLTERCAALASYSLFELCCARPGAGHEKGGVERRGQAIRLPHLTPIPCG